MDLFKFEAILVYIVSYRTVKAVKKTLTQTKRGGSGKALMSAAHVSVQTHSWATSPWSFHLTGMEPTITG